MSNLNEARALIQADLEHARQVLDLWTHQVGELEKALEQIDAVGTSRSALHVEYQGTKGTAAVLEAPAAMNDVPRRGRKPKNAMKDAPAPRNDIARKRSGKLSERSTVQEAKASEGKPARAAKKAAKKAGVRTSAAKYKDPNSDKTWTGHGRPPAWMQGDRAQYEVNAQGKGGAAENTDGAAGAGESQQAATA